MKLLNNKKSPNIIKKVMSLTVMHAPNLEVSKNKSNHIRFVSQRMFQRVESTSTWILCPTLTSIGISQN
jgi:hypothetical protein